MASYITQYSDAAGTVSYTVCATRYVDRQDRSRIKEPKTVNSLRMSWFYGELLHKTPPHC